MPTYAAGRIMSFAERLSLQSLPYDLLLNIAQTLSVRDIQALQLTCKALHEFMTTRPVYRHLAVALLRRCRAVPVAGFQRIPDLTTTQLISAVHRAARIEHAWATGTPKPSKLSPYTDSPGLKPENKPWYKIISSPPNEEVDWLSPVTSSYTLCATRSGKVVCWDIYRDVCVAEWNPNERWELWKCRVEFDIRTVYISMAKTLHKSEDDRLMEFILMKLEFPESSLNDEDEPPASPTFSKLTTFRTSGVVMNVFLLDPAARLLSVFVWVRPNSIGLYVLLDWDKPEYIFVDTGIECTTTSNWSCILHEDQIVIHSEESDVAHQYFYPIEVLRKLLQPSSISGSWGPTISAYLAPIRTLYRKFTFPSGQFPRQPPFHTINVNGNNINIAFAALQAVINGGGPAGAAPPIPFHPPLNVNNPNPFPGPWYPESAHFVRQWWPTLQKIPRLSCTVILLADHDPITHRTRYVLAQHYFRVPLSQKDYNEALLQPPKGDLDTPEEGSSGGSDRGSGSTAVSEGEGAPLALPKSDNEGDADDGSEPSTRSHPDDTEVDDEEDDAASDTDSDSSDADDALRIWYVSKPFEVACVYEGEEQEDDPQLIERPRPLMAVDFGHAVWVEYCDEPPTPVPPLVQLVDINGVQHVQITTAGVPAEPEITEAKRLRFVSFPAVDAEEPTDDDNEEDGKGKERADKKKGKRRPVEGVVRTLEIPTELNLDSVETINIDQSQGAVILSVKEGKIFILCYE
ncbi:hypothetical protein EUX98_g6855 [Antrodiella citrinella]|uniref:F-box domain-containing protein n=1 Tax=Antrodiella citrinella TaxID=2447956 RepID=A0A4S4MNS9_9APHY|nr:hypothetical protein EUX98_g6855 [Antrodiella citrinella]